MAVPADTRQPPDLVGEVERLLAEAEAMADHDAREITTGLVQALVDLYGAGLERIVELLGPIDDDGAIAASLAGDELVAHLLLLHGLHPVPVEERVRQALAEVSPYLESHSGGVELVGVEDAVVRVRLRGSCHGCPSSTMTLKLAIENSVHKLAPEIEEVVAEQADESPPALLQIELGPELVCPLPGAPA